MSVDELGRAAGAELLRAAAGDVDVPARRLDLQRRHGRRRREQVAAAAVAVALALAGGWWLAETRPREPAPPVAPTPSPTATAPRAIGNGAIVVALGARLRAVDPSTGALLPASGLHLPRQPADHVLPFSPADDVLAFSPDGTRLAGNRSGLWDVRAGSPVPGRLCRSGPCSGLAWSPDGRSLAVASADGIDVVTTGLSRRTPISTTARPRQLTWSPDGSRLAYTDPAGLHVMAGDGSGDRLLAPAALAEVLAQPAWSPDGSGIAYLAVGPPRANQPVTDRSPITVMLVPVTGRGFGRPHVVRQVGACVCAGFAPGLAWSPDGTRLAVVTINAAGSHSDGLYVMNADGTGLRLLRRGAWGQPAWQPLPS